ncbi:MAG: helix-turn-helix transcriptional regulator [Oscillospiraceae bacterium]
MNATFPRIISLLRREKHISQKQAALDLGISQALLSHYEKGIRECGLDFVVKISNYYGVSCDYLLGCSADRSGMMLTAEELPGPESAGREVATGSAGLLPLLHKKLISNSLNILFDLLGKAKNRTLVQEASLFLMLAVYRMFRVVYATDSKNAAAMFSLPMRMAAPYAAAGMCRAEANAMCIALGDTQGLSTSPGAVEPLSITSQMLSEDYPFFAGSLFNLIKNAEEAIAPGQKDQSSRK